MFCSRAFLLPTAAVFLGAAPLSAAGDSPYILLKEGIERTMEGKLVSPQKGERQVVSHCVIEAGVEKDGKKYLRRRTWLEIDGAKVTGESKLARKDAAGFYSIQEGQEGATEQCEIILPLKVGKSWEYISYGKPAKCAVIGLEKVTVGDKTYEDCFHLRATQPDGVLTEDFWESPNDGCVKAEIASTNGTKMTLTLKELKPGK